MKVVMGLAVSFEGDVTIDQKELLERRVRVAAKKAVSDYVDECDAIEALGEHPPLTYPYCKHGNPKRSSCVECSVQ